MMLLAARVPRTLGLPRPMALATLVVALVSVGPRTAAQPTESVESRIALAIAELGDARYAVREAASATLSAIGLPAEAALRAAAASTDPEVRARVSELLDHLAWSIDPAMSIEVREAIATARVASNVEERGAAMRALVRAAPATNRAQVAVFRREDDVAARRALAHQILRSDGCPPRALIAADRLDEAAALLDELAGTGDESACLAHAAFHLARGSLGTEIERVIAASPGNHARVAWMHRAAGRLDLALDAARRSDDPRLLHHLLVVRGDWTGAHGVSQPRSDRVNAMDHGYRALLATLAGDSAARDRSYTKLDELAKPDGAYRDDTFAIWTYLGERERALGVRPLADDTWGLRNLRSAWLTGLGQMPEALDCWDIAQVDTRSAAHFERGRILAAFGHREESYVELAKGVQAFEDGGGASNVPWNSTTLNAHPELKRRMVRRCYSTSSTEVEATWIDTLFHERADEFRAWSTVLRARTPDAIDGVLVRTLDALDGTLGADRLLDHLRAAIVQAERPDTLVGLGATCCRYGRAAEALELLEGAMPTGTGHAGAWTVLGRLAISARQWERAERAFGRAIQERPWSTWLRVNRAHALGELGRRGLLDSLLREIDLLELHDTYVRKSVALLLESLGRFDDARAQYDAVLRFDAPGNSPGLTMAKAIGSLRPPFAGGRPDDLERWARQAETVRLRLVYRAEFGSWLAPNLGVEIPLARGHAARLAGRPFDALACAEQALAADPHAAPAHALRYAVNPERRVAHAWLAVEHAWYDAMLALHPECADLHDRRAWFGACTRTRLDEALRSAERACELAPDVARYFGTLAEVRFQRGDRAGAIAACERMRRDGNLVFLHGRKLARYRDGTPDSDPR